MLEPAAGEEKKQNGCR
jgi:hypothetical protein